MYLIRRVDEELTDQELRLRPEEQMDVQQQTPPPSFELFQSAEGRRRPSSGSLIELL